MPKEQQPGEANDDKWDVRCHIGEIVEAHKAARVSKVVVALVKPQASSRSTCASRGVSFSLFIGWTPVGPRPRQRGPPRVEDRLCSFSSCAPSSALLPVAR